MRVKKIWVLTLFPEFFKPLMECGITGQALRGDRSEAIKFELECINVRDFSTTKYKSVDDTPYGGGPGMVMKAEILRDALLSVGDLDRLHVVYTSPRGKVWDNRHARNFGVETMMNSEKDIVFVCGRYEGIDERFLENYVHEYISLGDYVLTGGELAVMTIIDSAIRFVPGILGNKFSANEDSFEDGLLEHPQYTKPAEFDGLKVPDVLMNGNHKLILEWQKAERIKMTKKHRPDLLAT
jgi:tRNA (guanine37-N1)-methyltransferase